MRRKFYSKRVCGAVLTAVVMMQALTGCGGSNKTAVDNVGMSELTATNEAVTENVTEVATEETAEAETQGAAAETIESTLNKEMQQTSRSEAENAWDGGVLWDEEVVDKVNGETYDKPKENIFCDVEDEPLSTFAADVDTASYSNLRRMIMDGYGIGEIPTDSIRIEEMVNYFSYDLATPKEGQPFAVSAEMNVCPWNEEHGLFMVGMRTDEIDLSDAPASNLVFLIDVSGSMYDEDKLPLLQKSFCMLAENLSKNDRVSIVTYAGSDEVVLEGAKGNEYDKISKALNSLEAEGSTNGSAGIKTAYELAEEYFIEGGNNRVILATDGDLNVGITTASGLEELITEKKESGVFLSVLGFGTGNINDVNMETLADKGNGNYAYIDSVFEANRVLVSQLGATLFTVAKDVKLQVEFNPESIKSYRLLGYENRTMAAEDFHDDTKDGGEIGAGHCVVGLYEVEWADSKQYPLRYMQEEKKTKTDSKYADEYCAVSIRYKEPDGKESKLLTYPVKTVVKTDKASEDFLFAACVAEAGMILSGSEYTNGESMEAVYERLQELSLEEESRKEFAYLIEQLLEK